jgi:hypothetical protein
MEEEKEFIAAVAWNAARTIDGFWDQRRSRNERKAAD